MTERQTGNKTAPSASRGKERANAAPEAPGFDKKLDGPNRPAT
ncbi:spore protein [Paenibacillus sp. NEAU-GSW1]|nr:spore protein [Paenibacillus sp. NEAU-GSW1]